VAATSGHLDAAMAGLRGTLGLRRTLDRAVSCQAWSRAPAVACAAGAGGAGSGVRAPTGYGEAAAPSGSAGTDAEQTAGLPGSGLQDVGVRMRVEEGGGPGQCAGAAPSAGGSAGAGSRPDGWSARDAAEQDAGPRDTGGGGDGGGGGEDGWAGRDPALSRILRADLAAGAAAAQLFAGMAACSGRRPDLRFFQARRLGSPASAQGPCPSAVVRRPERVPHHMAEASRTCT